MAIEFTKFFGENICEDTYKWGWFIKQTSTTSENTWSVKQDQFTYHNVPIEAHFQYIKRNLFRNISSLYDPLSTWVSFPVLHKRKVLIQDVCVSEIDWG